MKKILLVVSITGFMFAEGKIGGVTYFDFISTDDSSAFNFQRQYFGYGGDISDKVSYKILFDVGRTELDTRLNVYLKKAQVNYKSSSGKVNFGLIGMNTYAVQESNWGYRFIEKSTIDKNGFSSTADLGVGFSKSIIDNLNLSFQIVNGEGFKKPQGDKYHKIAFNATYGESNLIKNDGYNAGLVYTTEQTDTDPITMTSIFGGFAGMGIRIGGEYDMKTIGGVNSNIVSVSTNYTVRDNIDVFVRYDIYDGDTSIDNNGKDYLVAGIVLTCDGGISVAPNVRTTTYEDETEALTEYKVNFQFKF
jgi:hypothetical protein